MKNSSTAISCCSFIAATFPIFDLVRMVRVCVCVCAQCVCVYLSVFATANGYSEIRILVYNVCTGKSDCMWSDVFRCRSTPPSPSPFGCWITRRQLPYWLLRINRLKVIFSLNGKWNIKVTHTHTFWGKTFCFHSEFFLSPFLLLILRFAIAQSRGVARDWLTECNTSQTT